MKLDDVEPAALAVEGLQARRVFVGKPPAAAKASALPQICTKCRQALGRCAAAFAVDGLHQRPVAW